MLTKKDLADTLGLSCVEKYFLAWLSKHYDISQLYGSAFVSLPQVFDDFSRGATYQSYNGLPRLQEVAEDLGIVKHEFKICSTADAFPILHNLSDNDLCLVRVNASFFDNFKRSAWREDHYICVNNNLETINEYPLSEGKFDEQSFAKIYDGVVCRYAINNLSVKVPDAITPLLSKHRYSLHLVPQNLDQTESALGVLRKTRKRMEVFYANNAPVHAMLSDENTILDRLYFTARLHLLKSADRSIPNDIAIYFGRLINIENKIAEELSK